MSGSTWEYGIPGPIEKTYLALVAPHMTVPTRNQSAVWVLPGVLILAIASVWRAATTWFWLDEAYTAYALAMPDLATLLRWNVESEMNPPAFFVTEWIWTRIVGTGDLGIRSLPILFACGAYSLTWLQVRRVFGFWAAMVIVPMTFAAFCRPSTFCEARPTINLIFAVALVSFVHMLQAQKRVGGWGLSAAHAYLCLTHTIGCLYSGSIFIALLVSAGLRDQTHRRTLGSVAVGWVAFTAWLPALLQQHKNTQPHYWIPAPTMNSFLTTVSNVVHLPIVLFAIAVAACIFQWSGAVDSDEGRRLVRRTSIAVATGVILGCPVAAFMVSLLGTSFFLDRYLLGGLVGWSLLLSAVWHAFFGDDRCLTCAATDPSQHKLHTPPQDTRWGVIRGRCVSATLASAGLIGLALPSFFVTATPRPGEWITRTVPASLPLIFEGPHTFLPALRYSSHRNMFFVLDKEASLDPRAHRSAIDNFYSFVLLKKYFPDFPVITLDELDALPEFAVVEDPYEQWADIRFSDNPKYEFKGLSKNPLSVVHIRRRADSNEDVRTR